MGFRGMRDKTFFVCGIRGRLQNYHGTRDSDICGIRDTKYQETFKEILKISRGNEIRSKIVWDTQNDWFTLYCAGNRKSRINSAKYK